MEKITSLQQLYKTPISELLSYFKTFKFKGRITELSEYNDSPQLSWACGKIEDINIDGEANFLCPKSLYIPEKFKVYVKKGPCEFTAAPDARNLNNDKPIYKLIIHNIKNISEIKKSRNQHEEAEFRRNLRMKDSLFVGLFTQNSDGSYAIRDIRRSDFSKVILQTGKQQPPIVYHPHGFKPIDGRYYEFTWILNSQREGYIYNFIVDESKPLKVIEPKDLIQRLHNDILNYPAGASQKIVKMLDTLRNQLTASGKEIFIYELLQNANDYPQINNGIKEPVDVEFHLTLSSLVFMHSGAEFNERNIAAICNINDKEKDTNKDAIGYKGIGFKTVFLDNDNVYIQTGGYSFRFDKKVTKDIVDTAWQILPINTPYSELTTAEKAIFTSASKNFRVKLSLKPVKEETLKNGANSYYQMFHEIFKSERVILFIPNLASVKVFLDGTRVPNIVCSKNTDKWRVDDFEEYIDESITEAINNDIDEQENTGNLKIPTKYYDFKKTKVSFACEVDGNQLMPVHDTSLYCYLPAKEAKWGLKFLMNTDMIPNGARDNIEVEFSNSINVNEEISKIAGSKLFDWIHQLCISEQYDINSIFGLIPNFDSIRQGRDKFKGLINVFKDGFENRLSTDKFIPTDKGFVEISNVILDETGLSYSGIVPDEILLNWLDQEDKCLPRIDVRQSKNLSAFVKTYLEKFKCQSNIFDFQSLHNLVDNNKSFREWLQNPLNNNKFIQFLLDNDLLNEFASKSIFINETDGKLFAACKLYYDIDNYLTDLGCFSNTFLSRLSGKTQQFFDQNKSFIDFAHINFKEFDSDAFVASLYEDSNIATTLQILSSKENSIKFTHFLADENIQVDKLPIFNSKDEIIADNALMFFDEKNESGYKIKQMAWYPEGSFDFVSNDYFSRDNSKIKTYLIDSLGVRLFSDEIIVKEIILDDRFVEPINDKITDISKSIEFIKFLQNYESLIPKDAFNSSYKLYIIDEDSFQTVDNNTFFASSLFDSYENLSWNNNCIFQLDNKYFWGLSEDQIIIRKRFMNKVFGVRELTKDLFYQEFVFDDIKSIYSTIKSDKDKNIDFWRWIILNNPSKSEELRKLPIIVKDNNGREFFKSPESTFIYMSDAYMQDECFIEDFVKEYISDALFVSSDYLAVELGLPMSKWYSFWINLDISAEVSRIIIDNILPDLKNIENDNLPSLLFSNWAFLKGKGKSYSDLKCLKLRCKNGKFYSINNCCFINTDKEPLNCISLHNEFNLRNQDQLGWFISEIAKNNNISIVSNVSEWRIRKIDQYLNIQKNDKLEINTHFLFIKEISDLEQDELLTIRDQIKGIFLLSKDGAFHTADSLTLGHIYNPVCDFEAYGVKSLTFLSEDYHKLGVNEKNLRSIFDLHRFFDKEDISNLEDNPRFANYIWYEYIKDPKQREKLLGYAEKGLFNNKPCLLSQDGQVCCPEDLYSNDIVRFIKDRTKDYKSKVVDDYIVSNHKDILSFLELKTSLDFKDSLTALLYEKTKEGHKLLLRWLCEGEIDEDAVAEFLNDPRATWKNCKGQDVMIKDLYAISPDNERLLSFFKTNDNILDVSYVLKGDFEKVCEILHINIINDEDVIPMPINEHKVNFIGFLKKSLFIISCVETEEWSQRYDTYKQKINGLEFLCCKAINLSFKENSNISVSAQRFYANNNQVFYVGNWSDRKVYIDIVRALHTYFGLTIDIEKAKDLFDPDEKYVDVIQDNCQSLLEDDNFLTNLKTILPDVYKVLFPISISSSNNNIENVNPLLDSPMNVTESNIEDDNFEEFDDNNLEDLSEEPTIHRDNNPESNDNEWEKAVCNFMGGGYQLPEDDIIAENIITRWRVLQYLKGNEALYSISPSFSDEDQKEYIEGDIITIPLSNGKKLLAQGAKGGIWYISPNVWRGFDKESLVVCLCVGNGADDFKFAESLSDIEECADTPNVLVKVSPKGDYSMMESIRSVFPGNDNYKMNIHLMVKVHSTRNSNLDSIFDKVFNAPQDDYDF